MALLTTVGWRERGLPPWAMRLCKAGGEAGLYRRGIKKNESTRPETGLLWSQKCKKGRETEARRCVTASQMGGLHSTAS